MRFKRVFVFLLLSCSLGAQERIFSLLDRIEATVNDELITHQDVARATLFYPILQEHGQTGEAFQRTVLEELIDYKVITLEFENEVMVREEDDERVQLAVIAKLGSLNALYPILRRLGMSWGDFKTFIREKVIYEKVISERLELRVVISYREIERFYNDHYLPVQQVLGLAPKSLVEMTAQIEQHLSKKMFAESMKEWQKQIRSRYRIEYLNGEK